VATVTALSVTPVKGLRVRLVDQIVLEHRGARDDHRFYVIDKRSRMVNGKRFPQLQQIIATLDGEANLLTFELPDGTRISETVTLGPTVETRFFSVPREGQLVLGPWSDLLSEHIGHELRLIATESSVDRGPGGATSLVSSASLRRLAAEADTSAVDARRFRMMIEVDGIDAHAEDAWVGRRVRAGEALLRFEGHVGRCLVTTRDPEDGEVDLPTLDLLRGYRTEVETTEPLAFGIYGAVVEPGAVRLGDTVELLAD
jgi:uncharacterized protein